jgi:hypothetical protein
VPEEFEGRPYKDLTSGRSNNGAVVVVTVRVVAITGTAPENAHASPRLSSSERQEAYAKSAEGLATTSIAVRVAKPS